MSSLTVCDSCDEVTVTAVTGYWPGYDGNLVKKMFCMNLVVEYFV